MKFRSVVLAALIAGAALAPVARPRAQQTATPLDQAINALSFRNIGPFRTAAWVT
jgi:hypothetical protein